ncbi:MAG: MFS transporter, partial [Treponema sp.]|nr:MFS transporter [Treponema sp.]
MTDRIHFKKFYPNYYSFLVNGAMVLLVGAILPYLMEESGINYSTAGLFLSAFAIGNFLASFVNPFLTKVVGRKASIVITSCL